ncbi:MAG: transglycosylase SLT domain-containing protein [Synergistaceae bacterium]|nr:transglycosylase SLT domain-containing protein [Synergistaceae bacterium]
MRNVTLKRKIILLVMMFLLVMACAADAKISKTQNIADLFTRVNPSLKANKAVDYAKVVINASEKHKQDPYAIAALIVHESTVNPNAISKGGDYGLMQIRWRVHEKAIKKQFPKVKKAKDILDVRINVLYGTEIFSYCMKKANNDLRGGVLRYSAGNNKLVGKVMATINELRTKDGTIKKVKAKKKK